MARKVRSPAAELPTLLTLPFFLGGRRWSRLVPGDPLPWSLCGDSGERVAIGDSEGLVTRRLQVVVSSTRQQRFASPGLSMKRPGEGKEGTSATHDILASATVLAPAARSDGVPPREAQPSQRDAGRDRNRGARGQTLAEAARVQSVVGGAARVAEADGPVRLKSSFAFREDDVGCSSPPYFSVRIVSCLGSSQCLQQHWGLNACVNAVRE